jgi:hypothetical protein
MLSPETVRQILEHLTTNDDNQPPSKLDPQPQPV